MAGDVRDAASLRAAMQGIRTAYYLVHSMAKGPGFAAADRKAAATFAGAAREAGVERFVYLGGLGGGEQLSEHLESRQEVGRMLRASGVPTIEFRASIVIGSGSLSFEMIRGLVERLPLMVTPRWVRVSSQPIAIEDVVAYLVAAREIELEGSRVFEIGGADVVSYAEIMREYARQRGLRRLMLPVPVLTPRLSGLWLGLVTPIYARVGRQLVDSIRHPTVAEDAEARAVFGIQPRGIREAIARALRNEDHSFAETRWSDAVSSAGGRGRRKGYGGERVGSRLIDRRRLEVDVPPEVAFRTIRRMGGSVGWYYADWLWRLRGFLDLLVGGVGVRRGRRDPELLAPGDTVDFWRVEAVEPERLVRLAAEMKLPGRAWLQFEVRPRGDGAEICQTAMFDPVGLSGLLYWYALYPVHAAVFRGMLRGIVRAAERGEEAP